MKSWGSPISSAIGSSSGRFGPVSAPLETGGGVLMETSYIRSISYIRSVVLSSQVTNYNEDV